MKPELMPLNVLRDIRKIYTGLNADSIREEAWRDLNVGLLAADESGYNRMEAFLAPPFMERDARNQALRCIHPADGQPDRFDFVLCEPGIPVPRNGYLFESDQSDSLVNLIVTEHQDLELALARVFPLFRKPVSDRIINRIARDNALFSLVTALPNVVPSLIELPWSIGEFASDTAFLTMNQVRMALQLAAAHGRPVGYVEQKIEIAAIAAGAFGWRAIARELVGKIPLGGGLIPKAAVAFAGTYVVGLGLEKANSTGSGLSRQEKREAYAMAFSKGREVVSDLAPDLIRSQPLA
jgi:hypothetical protein